MSPLKNLTKPDTEHNINALFYGDPGTGKTFLAGSAADYDMLRPVLLVDVEGGTLSLSGKDIDVFRPDDWDDIQEVYDVLRREKHGFKTVIIDSLTEIQRKHSMGFIMGELGDDSEGYHDLGRAVSPDRQDWLRTGDQMRKFIRAFRDLAWNPQAQRRVHVIMTALEKINEKTKIVGPEMPGKLGTGAGAFVDILGRLSLVPTEDGDHRRHLLLSQYEDRRGLRYLAKNRGGRLGRQMWDPTMRKIMETWLDPAEPKVKRARGSEIRRREPEEDDNDDA